jgi:hypothetical protein
MWLALFLAASAPASSPTPTWLVLLYYVSASIIALATIIFGFARFVWPMLRDIRDFLSGWNGIDPRPDEGYEGRPGVMKRLQTIEYKVDNITKELHPNSGTSMKDQLNELIKWKRENEKS